MKEGRTRRIRMHFREYREMYIAGAVCFGIGVVAGITTPIMRSNIARGAMIDTASKERDSRTGKDLVYPDNTESLSFFNGWKIGKGNSITASVHTGGKGNSGFITRNLEHDTFHETQGGAALFYGIPSKVLSKHLNGEYKDAHGLHFERVNLVEVN